MKGTVEPVRLAEARKHFPALERWTYMDVAGRSILSREVRAAIDAHLDDRMYNGATSKDQFFEMTERARGRFAELIGAEPDEVTYTKNISEGLNIVATGIDWRPGDNVVLCPDLEHPNNVYTWLNLRERYGVEVQMVPAREGHIDVQSMLKRINDRTRVVTVSEVTFAPGFRCDVDALGEACRERDILLLLDGAQSTGFVHTNVRDSKIDAIADSTQKGLLALYGVGFLYVRREWAERMKPAYLARFGVDLGDAHEASIGDFAFKLARGARRFDVGNYNFVGIAAVDKSMEQLLGWGTRNIEAYLRTLSHALANGFIELGLPVAGGKPDKHMAQIVTVGTMSTDQYGTGDPRYNRLYEHLTSNRVKLSIRRGMLRFSLHVYNNMEDVARVLDLTKQFLRKAA
jgi:cysteine desulfurase/selenocysteine lyase